jgi:RNA methyltransferase, TrmH family
MLSKNKIKQINSLSKKKKRDETGLFVAEGSRLVGQLMHYSHPFQSIIALPNELDKFSNIECEKATASIDEMKKISLLKSPPDVIALCRQTLCKLEDIDLKNELVIALDDIQDPGNLGTIIRLASWFGIKHIVCSNNSADCYNPKVVQSTMGAIAKVSVHYTDLRGFIITVQEKGTIVYGTLLDGNNIYSSELEKAGIVVFGNEGNGISPSIEALIGKKLYIPPFSEQGNAVESLNIASAASIVCSEFRRR